MQGCWEGATAAVCWFFLPLLSGAELPDEQDRTPGLWPPGPKGLSVLPPKPNSSEGKPK